MPMITGRSSPAAARGLDDRIYAIGGTDGTQPLASVEAYGPAGTNDVWAPAPPLKLGRQRFAAAADDGGRILAFGGEATGPLATATSEIFAPPYDGWQPAADLIRGRAGLTAAVGADGRVYAIGGDNGSGESAAEATVEAYSYAANRWVAVAGLAMPRTDLAAARGGDGRIYAIGGIDTSGRRLTTVEAYGPILSLSALRGRAGAQIDLSGSNFAADAQVTITLVSAGAPALELPIATGRTDSAGALPPSPASAMTINVPAVPAGSYLIRAIDAKSRYPAVQPFTVEH
jgi:hypothetical protein